MTSSNLIFTPGMKVVWYDSEEEFNWLNSLLLDEGMGYIWLGKYYNPKLTDPVESDVPMQSNTGLLNISISLNRFPSQKKIFFWVNWLGEKDKKGRKFGFC